MKAEILEQPRVFSVVCCELKHCASLYPDPNDLVTFVTPSGAEHDVTYKAWGFYATASLNERLPNHGLRPALITTYEGKYHVVLVEKEDEFMKYLEEARYRLVAWLDNLSALKEIDDVFQRNRTA